MQDVHWYFGPIGGMFQGYTLGNILSAQFYDAAVSAHPEIPAEMQAGKFSTLHAWLVEHVYQHGRKFTAPELVLRAAGQPLTIAPYIRYLRTKYGELYRL
jgi:carboxypeptidase Taq